MYLKDNLRGSSSALLLSYPTHPPFLFFLLHYILTSYSLFSSSAPCLLILILSILIHHLPPLASMHPRIPIFPILTPSPLYQLHPLLRIPHSPLFRIPSSISLSFFLITSPISLSLSFLFYLLISLPLFPILAFPIPPP